MNTVIKASCLGTLIMTSLSANAFESFEGYTGGDVIDSSTPITNMVSFDQCTDGEKSLQITFPQDNAWASVKTQLTAAVDFTANTHFSFDAIRDVGEGDAPLLVKLIDSSGKDVWHWITIDQDGPAVYSLDLSYNDSGDTDGDLKDIVMVELVDASNAGGNVEVYFDNLRLSDGSATVGAGCSTPTDPTAPEELREGGSTSWFGLLGLLGIFAWRRKFQ